MSQSNDNLDLKVKINAKDKVRNNSFKHGLRSSSLVVAPNNLEESQSEYEALVESLNAIIKPKGVFEEHCIHAIAKGMYRLRRADALEAGLFISSDNRFDFGVFSEGKSSVLDLKNPAKLDLVLRYRSTISNEITRALSAIHTFRNCFQYDLFEKGEANEVIS